MVCSRLKRVASAVVSAAYTKTRIEGLMKDTRS